MRYPTREYRDRIMKNAYSGLETTVGFLPLIPSPSNIYGENPYKTYGEVITVKGFLEMDPSELRLQDLGWKKESVNLIVKFPFINLLEAGLAKEDGSLLINTNYKMDIPHKERPYQVSSFQGREPYFNNVPVLVWVGGRVFTNGN